MLLISNGEKILSNVNAVVRGQVKSENSQSLPVAVRVSKTCVLKLPIRWLPCGYRHVRMSWSRKRSVLRQGLSIQMEAKAWDQPAFLSTYKLPLCRINMNCWRFFMTVILFWRKENFATDLQLKVGRNKCSISSLRTSIGQILSPLACNAKGPKGDRAWDLHDIWLFISYSCSADVLLTWTREPWSSLDLD